MCSTPIKVIRNLQEKNNYRNNIKNNHDGNSGRSSSDSSNCNNTENNRFHGEKARQFLGNRTTDQMELKMNEMKAKSRGIEEKV